MANALPDNVVRGRIVRNGLHRRQLKVVLSEGTRKAEFVILLYTPAEATLGVPLFLGLNFAGNHTIHHDPAIFLPDSWCRNNDALAVFDHRANESGRGGQSSRWPVELLLGHGYGLATVYCGDLAPDDPERMEEGVLRFFPLTPSRGGCISAWAWGLSRALDALREIPEVDGNRVTVIGHSRRGKAALWAGANDERFRAVISNNSGSGMGHSSARGISTDRSTPGDGTAGLSQTRRRAWYSTLRLASVPSVCRGVSGRPRSGR